MTTIKRQYSLPKCSLQLEGMATDDSASSSRPLLSMLLQAECHFTDGNQRLTGGRDFLESLVKAVSLYAQEVLSGLGNPAEAEVTAGVQLWPSEQPGCHHLRWSPPEGPPIELELTTLQLADLVDAVDQFFADSRTLPDLTLQLAPVSRRYRPAEVPVGTQAQPLVMGLGSLAIAALALFFVPIPEVQEPEVRPEAETEDVSAASGSDEPDTDEPEASGSSPDEEDEDSDVPADADPDDEASDDEDSEVVADKDDEDGEGVTDTDADDEISEVSDDEVSDDEADEPNDAAPERPRRTTVDRDRGETITAAELEALLEDGETIADPTDVKYIERYLYREINQSWDDREDLREDLAYRVTATVDGAIVAYEPIETTPAEGEDLTPLPDLTFLPTQAAIAAREATVDFKVVFTRGQALQVNPWHGYAGRPELGERIDARDAIADLQEELADALDDGWDEDKDTRGNDLVFRVAVTEDGAIADYYPQNNAAFSLVAETPLPELLDPAAGRETGSVIPSEPLGQFQVVFKPDGVVEVSPF